MYERAGMGFSDLTWYETIRRGLDCEAGGPDGKPTEICFETTPEDEAIAHHAGCTRLTYASWVGDAQPGCHDDGRIWCCPENQPRDYMQNIPSDVSSHEEERLRLLALEPGALQPDEPGSSPDETDRPSPRPGYRHTFWTRLTHPGAITAMATIAGGGALFFFLKRRRERR